MKCTVSQRRDFSSGHCKCNLVLRVFASQNPSHKTYCVPDAKEIYSVRISLSIFIDLTMTIPQKLSQYMETIEDY